jgi:integrase
VKGVGRDTRTRTQGVYARHRNDCRVETGGKCSCKPSYWAKVWDRSTARTVKTARFAKPSEAAAARVLLQESLRRGVLPTSNTMRLEKAIDAFLRAAESGVALNKHGRRYKPSAIRDLRGALENHVKEALGQRRIGDVRRADVQQLIDGMAGRSGSTVRKVVNAIRSLYRWAQDREMVQHDPAALVRLPAMDATPRDRVATPVEMAALLAALPADDALPFALAVYATARRGEIRHLTMDDVDLKEGLLYLGADENGRKSRAAQREVPIVKPLAAILRRAQLARKPRRSQTTLLCPGEKPGGRNSGLLSFEALQTRADKAWKDAGLQRITAHECRHTAISWMDAAGVRGRVISQLAGHALQHDGAQVTGRYTHTLPGDIAQAGKQLDAYLVRASQNAEVG